MKTESYPAISSAQTTLRGQPRPGAFMNNNLLSQANQTVRVDKTL